MYFVNPYDKLEHDHDDIFFISDLHVGHDNVIKFDKRPFSGVEEMSEKLIENWNSVVNKDSIVYFLGDLSYKVKSDYIKWFVHQLNGDIRVITGNHDRPKELAKLKRFSDIQIYKRLEIIDTEVKGEKQDLILCHYPIMSWDKQRHGSIHLHGHCHQNLTISNSEYYSNNRVIDVGCMGHNYTPLSYTQIKDIINSKN